MSEEEVKNQEQEQPEDDEMDSGVEGVKADGGYKQTPVFDVSKEAFFKNMRLDRNKTRFPRGHKASQFMSGTKYRKPFYVRYKDSNGTPYLNKFK